MNNNFNNYIFDFEGTLAYSKVADITAQTSLYRGVKEVLKTLYNADKKLFVATLNSYSKTVWLLEQLKIKDYFYDVYAIDKLGYIMPKEDMISEIIKTYSLVPEETVMIGDSATDIIAAKRNDIVGIGAIWNKTTDKCGVISLADFTIKTPEDLLPKSSL